MDVICLGLACYDILLRAVDHDIMTKDLGLLQEKKTATGGDALNASINLASLGFDTSLIVGVGEDRFGDEIVAHVQKMGVHTEHVARLKDVNTSISVVLIEQDGERHFAYYSGCNAALGPEHVPEGVLSQARHLHFASANVMTKLDGAGIASLFKRAKKLGLSTSMDVTQNTDGTPWLDKIALALPYCDIFIPSHYEAEQICGGIKDFQRMKAFFQSYGLKVFGIKMGADGLLVTDYEKDVHMPTLFTGTPVDTTGAGDACVAGFIAGYLRGYSLADCAALGAAQAAMIIGQVGATAGVRPLQEVLDYAASKGYNLPR